MNRRLVFAAGALALSLAVPAVSLAAPATTPFAGRWTSEDFDGSHQTLVVSAGTRPSVVYQDFYASGCDTFAGPATHWVAAGQGSIDDDLLLADFRKSGCGTFLQGGYQDWYAYDAGSDSLTDSAGIVWTRSR
jgi:hypothetical protein